MKKLVLALFCCLCVLFVVGCQGLAKKPPVKVTNEGDGSFPDFLVGKWQADKGQWEFVFEPDGTISSAVIDNGMVRVKPTSDRITTIPMKMGGKGIYKLGQWAVQYSPETRELVVEVVVDHFHLEMGPSALEGNSEDWFIGRVSEDSQTWVAEWTSFPKYIAYTPDPNELPVDIEDSPRGTLIFRKVQ